MLGVYQPLCAVAAVILLDSKEKQPCANMQHFTVVKCLHNQGNLCFPLKIL
uniref:Uncharacterized protein n=1 Tax=Oryzias latipes TaxID=8090 RepID=A0A3P9LQY5_ORYLA